MMEDVSELNIMQQAPDKTNARALILLAEKAGTGARVVADTLKPKVADAINEALAALDAKGAADEVTRIPAVASLSCATLAIVGTGVAADEIGPAHVRDAIGAAVRNLAGVESVAALVPADEDSVYFGALGGRLGAYAYDEYLECPAPPATIDILVDGKMKKSALSDIAKRVNSVARAVHATRDLVNTPPADLFPESFAHIAEQAAKSTRSVSVDVWDDKKLADQGFGGLIGVGRGSERGPRLVKVDYKPRGAKAHLALVGKGITFDSGGLSLKPPKSMETMKTDMTGAATVLSTVVAAAELGLPVHLTGWLCLAENMPSGTATRPGDVLRMYSGRTVEVNNTDAEGRLVLGDGLARACEEGPDAIIDIATLTGAQIVALGGRISGVMGTDEIRNELVEAADAAGEEVWPMPLPEHLKAGMKSLVADTKNSGGRGGGMLTAGLFLSEFVGETPWAHIDIAGPSFNEEGPFGATPKGATGVMVQTLLAWIGARVS